MSFSLEPALWVGAAEAILVLLIAFGIPISAEQKTAIIGAITAVLVIVGSIVIRQQVTPVAKLRKAEAEAEAATASVSGNVGTGSATVSGNVAPPTAPTV